MQAYDQHLNMILGDVEETITSIEIDDETYEEIVKVLPGQDMSWQCHAHDCEAHLDLDASQACQSKTDVLFLYRPTSEWSRTSL